MSRKKLYLVAYDIVKDKSRNKLAHHLEDLGGERVNYSVFEIMLSPARYLTLIQKLHRFVTSDRDQIILYPVCKQCYKQSVFIPEREPASKKSLIEV